MNPSLVLLLGASLALWGCGGIVLVAGGAAAGVSSWMSSLEDDSPRPCPKPVDALWTGYGPEGGTVLSVSHAILPRDPDRARILAGTRGTGAFWIEVDLVSRTVLGDWTRTSPEIGTLSVHSALIDAEDPEVFIIGTNDGIYRSTDRGATWERPDETSLEARSKTIWHLVQAPWDPSTFFAATTNSVLFSNNKGIDWLVEGSTVDEQVTGFATISSPTPAIFASLWGNGVWRRLRGEKWLPPDPTFHEYVHDIAATPDGGAFPEGVLFITLDDRILRSDDLGVTWSPWDPPDISFPHVIREIAVNSEGLIAVSESSLTGLTDGFWLFPPNLQDPGEWTASPGDRVLGFVAIPTPVSGDIIVAGTETEGVWIHTDLGSTTVRWQQEITGLQATEVSRMVAMHNMPERAFAGTRSAGLFYRDERETWAPIADEDLHGQEITAMALTLWLAAEEKLYVGTPRGLYVCEDPEAAQPQFVQEMDYPWGVVQEIPIRSLAFDPIGLGDPLTPVLYVGVDDGLLILRHGQGALVYAPDEPPDGVMTAMAVDTSTNPHTLYLGTDDGKVYSSPGDVLEWTKDPVVLPAQPIVDMVVTRSSQPTLFVAQEEYGVYRRGAGNLGWTLSARCLPDLCTIRDLALDPSPDHPDRIYAATNEGVFFLDSPGSKWKAIGGAEGENPAALSVALPQIGESAIYVGFPRGARRVYLQE